MAIFALVLTLVVCQAVLCRAQPVNFTDYVYATGVAANQQLLNLELDAKAIEDNTKSEKAKYADAYYTYRNGNFSIKSPGVYRSFSNLTVEDAIPNTYIFNITKQYWGTPTKADEYVSSAILGTGPFSGTDIQTAKDTRKEGAKGGLLSLHLPFLVLQSLEEAVRMCRESNTALALSNWDAAFAYYVGKEETGNGKKGKMFFSIANKRCKEACTCEDDEDGMSPANTVVIRQFISGQAAVNNTLCEDAQVATVAIRTQMLTVLIQGVIREMFRSDPVNFGYEGETKTEDILKKRVEGYSYLVGALPFIATCNPATASRLDNNMLFNSTSYMADGWQSLVADLHALYPCLGLQCDQVGGYCKEIDEDDDDERHTFVVNGCPTTAPSHAPSGTPTKSPSLRVVQPTYTVGDIVGASMGGVIGVGLISAAGFFAYHKYTKTRLNEMLAIELKDGASTHYRD